MSFCISFSKNVLFGPTQVKYERTNSTLSTARAYGTCPFSFHDDAPVPRFVFHEVSATQVFIFIAANTDDLGEGVKASGCCRPCTFACVCLSFSAAAGVFSAMADGELDFPHLNTGSLAYCGYICMYGICRVSSSLRQSE